MTISAARLAANRRNAQKSNGPVTEAGKQRIRLNAWKHGLRAESDAVAPDEAGAVAARREEWSHAFPAGDGHQRWLVDQLTLASVRIDRCQAHQRTQARFEADRAATSWDVDREADAADLGARLHRDADRVVSRLRRTVAGLDWLLARWRGLAERLDLEGTWDDAQRRLCLDLMQTPDEFRASELALLDALPLDELRDLAREHLDGLESLRDSAASLDDANRGLAEIGLPTTEHSELRRLRHYEAALWRRFRSLEASWKAARALDPKAEDDPDLDADPIGDLLAYARMTAPEPVPAPEAAPHPPEPAPRPGPPGPRPDRSTRRVDPSPTPTPTPTATEPPTIARTSPAVRLVPAAPPVMENRRSRRARKKLARQSR